MAVRTRTTYRMSVELQEDTFVELYCDTFVELLETLLILGFMVTPAMPACKTVINDEFLIRKHKNE